MRLLVLLSVLAACRSSEGLLEGKAGDPAVDALLDVEEPELSEADLESTDLAPVARNRVLALLSDTATVGEVNDLGEELDAELLGSLPEVGLVVLGSVEPSDDLQWVTDALVVLDASDAVEAALPSVVLEPTVVPPVHDIFAWDAEDGPAWGLRHIRAPMLWSLRPQLVERSGQVPHLLVLDEYHHVHADITWHADTEAFAIEGVYARAAREKHTHALRVGSLIAAHFDDDYVEGVLPAGEDLPVLLRGHHNNFRDTAADLRAVRDAVFEARKDDLPLVVNHSSGLNYIRRTDDGIVQSMPSDKAPLGVRISGNAFTERAAVGYRRFEEAMGGADWLYVCTTGNSRVEQTLKDELDDDGVELAEVRAEQTSGCARAAVEGSDRYLAAEALDVGGASLWRRSSRGGTIAAPGVNLGIAEVDPGGVSMEGTDQGTSLAAPLVSGVIAALWTVHPEASPSQIRSALLNGSKVPVADGPVGLDAWSALLQLDEVQGPDVERWLVDLDDGTLDGFQRLDATGVEQDVAIAAGDGCVDMSDARALRDAVLIADDPLTTDLDGVPGQRDLNLDGHVEGASAEHPGAVAGEHVGARFDLDGDDDVDVHDFAVLQRHWLDCDGEPAPDAWDAELLYDGGVSDLLDSVDLWVAIDADDSTVTVDGVGRSYDLDDRAVVAPSDQAWALVTVPSDLPVTVCVEHPELGEGCESVPAMDTPAGADVYVHPTLTPPVTVDAPVVFWSVDGSYDTETGFFAPGAHAVRNPLTAPQWTGVLMPTFDDMRRFWVDPLGRVLTPFCLDAGSLYCLAAYGPTAPDVAALLNPPGWYTFDIEVLDLSSDGSHALVRETLSDYTYRYFRLDLEASKGCPTDGTECNVGFEEYALGSYLPYQEAGLRADGSIVLDAGGDIHVATLDGADPTLLLVGAKLARTTGSPVASSGEVLVIDATDTQVLHGDGSQTVLTTSQRAKLAAWTSDGVVYVADDGSFVYAALPDLEPVVWASGDYSDATPSVSPDGSVIALWDPTSGPDGTSGTVHLFDYAGDSLGSLTHDDSAGEAGGPPWWAPTGSAIAVVDAGPASHDVFVWMPGAGAINVSDDVNRGDCEASDTGCERTDQFRVRWGRPLR